MQEGYEGLLLPPDQNDFLKAEEIIHDSNGFPPKKKNKKRNKKNTDVFLKKKSFLLSDEPLNENLNAIPLETLQPPKSIRKSKIPLEGSSSQNIVTLKEMKRPVKIEKKIKRAHSFSLFLTLFIAFVLAVSGAVAFMPFFSLPIVFYFGIFAATFITQGIIYRKPAEQMTEILFVRGINNDLENNIILREFFNKKCTFAVKNPEKYEQLHTSLKEEVEDLYLNDDVSSAGGEHLLKSKLHELFIEKLDYWRSNPNRRKSTELDTFIQWVKEEHASEIALKQNLSKVVGVWAICYSFAFACFSMVKFFKVALLIFGFLGIASPPPALLIITAVIVGLLGIAAGSIFAIFIFRSLQKANINGWSFFKKMGKKLGITDNGWLVGLLLLPFILTIGLLAILTVLADSGAYLNGIIDVIMGPISFFAGHSFATSQSIIVHLAEGFIVFFVLPPAILFGAKHSISAIVKISGGIHWLLSHAWNILRHPLLTVDAIKDKLSEVRRENILEKIVTTCTAIILVIIVIPCLILNLLSDVGVSGDGADNSLTDIGFLFDKISTFLNFLVGINISGTHIAMAADFLIEGTTEGDFIIDDGRNSIKLGISFMWNTCVNAIRSTLSFCCHKIFRKSDFVSMENSNKSEDDESDGLSSYGVTMTEIGIMPLNSVQKENLQEPNPDMPYYNSLTARVGKLNSGKSDTQESNPEYLPTLDG